jgi:predicted ATPase/class 3 adenylate cyclase
MLICPQCQEIDDGDDARFCRACGTPLHALLSAETRRVVTIVRCDVIGSTRLGELLDPEILRRVMGRYFEAARQVLRGHGGMVQKYIGDAVMAVFGIPTLHEDDALRAVRAAADLRVALRRLEEELAKRWGVRLPVRIGVQTGEVVAGDPSLGDALVVGDAVNVAARLEQAAGHGEILIGEATWQLVRDAVGVEEVAEMPIRNRSRPVRAFRLLHVEPGARGRRQRSESPMLGRDRELELLKWAFERTCTEGACHLVTVLGMPGIGKSRLVNEFISEIGQRASVFRGHCLPYGDGITFWPMVEVVRQAAGIAGTDTPALARMRLAKLTAGEERGARIVDSVAQVLGVGEESGAPTDAFFGLHHLLELLARRRPLVVVVDDLHWAEPTLLDLIEYIANWARDVPILLVCMARPELRERRAQWAGGALNATSLLLTPLLRRDAERVAEHLLGTRTVDPEVSARIAEMAEGNPLFIELFVSQLTEEGMLAAMQARTGTDSTDRGTAAQRLAGQDGHGSDGHADAGDAGLGGALGGVLERTVGPAAGGADRAWGGRRGGARAPGGLPAGRVPIPSTIQMLLAARLEQLGPAERAAIERASIVGKQFHLRDIVALSDADMHAGVRQSLASLSQAELIGPDPTAVFTLVQDDEAYRFRHLLMRDAAYQAIPKETRAELHERYATWLAKAAGEQTAQFDELLGYHLEQAHHLRVDLGYRDARSADLATRASERLAAAGRRARDRGDSSATVALLSRAAALQASGTPAGDQQGGASAPGASARLGPLLDLAEALRDVGEFPRSVELYEEAARLAQGAAEPGLALESALGWLEALRRYDLDALLAEAPATIERAFELYTSVHDSRGLARAWRLRAVLHLVRGECTPALPAIDQAIALARESGDRWLEARGRREACMIRHLGPTPAAEATLYIEASLGWAREHGMRALEAVALSLLARDAALAGDHEGARLRLVEADRILSGASARVVRVEIATALCLVQTAAGEHALAERALRGAREQLAATRAKGHVAPISELLARTLLAQGRTDEAADELAACERVTAAGDVLTQGLRQGLLARTLAATGDPASALATAERALATVEGCDVPSVRAAVLLDAAEVYRLAGRTDDAARATTEAMGWYERKGIPLAPSPPSPWSHSA